MTNLKEDEAKKVLKAYILGQIDVHQMEVAIDWLLPEINLYEFLEKAKQEKYGY